MGFHRNTGAVYALFENLASAATIDEFVEWFSDVGKQQVCAVLDMEQRR